MEERCCITLEALRWLEDHAPEDTLNAQPMLRASSLRRTPTGTLVIPNDPNDQQLERYQKALLGGMKEGGEKAMNLSKIQKFPGPDESPSQFYK
jgi:hypothetical protein